MSNRATGIGSMPGEDFAETVRIVLGELGEFAFLPELPARGLTAGMIGRSLAMVSDLGFDVQPAGWRLTDSSGIDHRRAGSLLSSDLDTVEEVAQRDFPEGYRGAFKVQVAGPWTLAANVERPRGDKVLADHGARRDLGQALAAGLTEHIAAVHRRLPAADIVVQVDEPMLPAVLAGTVSTASGFSKHRSVTPADAATAIQWLADVAEGAGAETALHCCAAGLPWEVVRETTVQGVSLDAGLVTAGEYDDVAEWVEGDRRLWLGIVPAADPVAEPPTDADVVRRVQRWWSALGYTDVAGLPPVTLTPSCGLAGASPEWSRQALALVRAAAVALSEEQGRIGA